MANFIGVDVTWPGPPRNVRMLQQHNCQAGKFPFPFPFILGLRPFFTLTVPFYPFSFLERKPGTKQPTEGEMVRGSSSTGLDQESKAGSFFMATLVMWAVSVLFEIVFNKRTELLFIIAGFFFYQFSNWVIRNYLSRDPLFVNTCVSLLHSSITSATGDFWIRCRLFFVLLFDCGFCLAFLIMLFVFCCSICLIK